MGEVASMDSILIIPAAFILAAKSSGSVIGNLGVKLIQVSLLST